jgi:hypothetical protein
VLKCQGARVVLNVGRADGATEKSRFLIYNAAAPADALGGQLCRAEDRPVQLQIDRLQQTTSTARVIPSAADALVKAGYHVYTR